MFGQYPNAQSVSHICWRGPFHARQKRRQENRQVGAAESGMKSMKSNGCNIEQRNWVGWTNGYGSKPIDTFFRAMNTHLQAILMSTRGIGFWPIPKCNNKLPNKQIFHGFPVCFLWKLRPWLVGFCSAKSPRSLSNPSLEGVTRRSIPDSWSDRHDSVTSKN